MANDELLLRTKQKEKEEQRQPVTENNVYADAMLDMVRRDGELQSSRFEFWGVTHKDSAEMTAVKTATHDLTQSMFGSMAENAEAFENQLRGIKDQYRVLIGHCEAYIKKSGRPFTSAGQERLRLVRGTLAVAQQEELLLSDCAHELFLRTGGKGLFWVNVLGEIRTAEINTDNEEVQLGGNATSVVTMLGQGDNMRYFKDEEKLRSPEDEFKSQYLDTEARKAKYSAFLQLAPDSSGLLCTASDKVKFLLSQGQRDEAIQYLSVFLSQAEHPGLDLTDRQTMETILEIMPSIVRWVTRNEVCKVAGIEEGSVLSSRNVATSRMAKLLGLPALVADSQTVALKQNGQTLRKGNIMKKAVGRSLQSLMGEGTLEYTPEMVRQLSILQVFDTLCGQVDRNLSNYMATSQKENGKVKLTGLQGIDNDMGFGTLRYNQVKNTPNQVLPQFENEQGRCSVPALDGTLVATINALSEEALTHTFMDLLSREELGSLLDRFRGMRDAINRAIRENPEIVVASGKWDEKVMRRFKTAGGYVQKDCLPD